MNSEERERRRVERLRAEQLGARDPGPSKIRNYDWSNQRPRKRRSILAEFAGGFTLRLRITMIAFVVGLIIAVTISLAAPAASLLGLAAMLLLTLIGWVLGALVQSS